MKKTLTKIISVMLAVVITLTLASLSAFVGFELPEWLDFSIEASAATTSGTCGDNLTWIFDESTGTLTISGIGSMYNYGDYICPWESKNINNVVINNSVTTIGDQAFAGCLSLTSVTIPDSVTTIGYGAFYYCESLTSITIPDGVTTIGDYAFCDCERLTSVTIPDSVTTIGDHAFTDCASLTSVTIPDSVTTIGDYAFCDCERLTSVTIPDSVTTIGDCAFATCTSLTSITVDCNNQYYSSDEYGVLFNKHKTILIQYSIRNSRVNYVIPDSVTAIGDQAFTGCASLTSVTIPDSVTTIGYASFAYCSGLTCVIIPDSVTTIGDSTFAYCTSLTSVTIPDSVITIGNYAFVDCTGLTSVSIGDSVTTIGDAAFACCYRLANVTISNSVTTIGDEAFYSCDNIDEIYYTGTEEQFWQISFGSNNSSLGRANIHFNSSGGDVSDDDDITSDKIGTCGNDLTWSLDNNGVLTISGTGDMYNWPDSLGVPWVDYQNSILSIVIEEGVTSIGDYAFDYCTNLKEINLPESLTSIGESAFVNCSNLISDIVIPKSLISIGSSAFYGCNSLNTVSIYSFSCSINDSSDTIPTATVIYCCPGSTAQAYAEKYSREYVANHTFENGMCIYCNTSENLLFVESDKHIEGLVYELNSVIEFQFDMNLEGKYVTVFDINGTQLTDNDLVGTGATVYIYDSTTNELLSTYTVVLYGDVNGDGLINDTDKEIITLVATCAGTIENEWCLMAADTNHDGAVDGFDVIETDLQALDMHNIEQVNNSACLPKDEEDESKPTIDEEDPDGDGWWG